MEKSQLGVAGLIAGVLGLILGVVGIMKASGARDMALEATDVANSAISQENVEKAVKLAVANALKDNEAEMAKLVASAERRVTDLMENTERVDILNIAKVHANDVGKRVRSDAMDSISKNTDDLRTLRMDLNQMFKQAKVKQEAEFKRMQQTLLRQVQRWQETGAM